MKVFTFRFYFQYFWFKILCVIDKKDHSQAACDIEFFYQNENKNAIKKQNATLFLKNTLLIIIST